MTKRIGVIGGGIVGVALARALSMRGIAEVTVLEKENALATHQTGRNSGVVHAGLYYTPGSMKARLCTAGRILIREFCEAKDLPYRELGKLVVAVDESELPALGNIESRSRSNGVPGLVRLDDTNAIHSLEPYVRAVAALHSPHTAAVDYAAITEAMAIDVKEAGGTVLLNSDVCDIQRDGSSHVVVSTTNGGSFRFDRVVACAGLHSDIIGRLAGADASPKILPFRGEYWTLDKRRDHLVTGMVYPVPDPSFPFLGVHFTRSVHDRIHIGPNAVPALAREGYRWGDISAKDTWASLSWPGAGPLARKHWRMGIEEITGSLFKSVYFKRAQRFIPDLRLTDLIRKDGAGVRAQAWARDGSLLDDFLIDQIGQVVVLRNAPSPAATSSLAIADYVVETFLK